MRVTRDPPVVNRGDAESKSLIDWVLWILRFDRDWVLLATKHINVWQVMVGVESSAFLPQWRNCHVNSLHKYPFSAVSSLAPLVLYFNNIWPTDPCYPFVFFLQTINIYSVCCVNFSWPSVCRGNFLHYSSVTYSEKQAISMRCCNSSLQDSTGQALRHVFWGKSRHAFTTETQGAGCHCTAGFLWSHWHRTKG